MRLAYAPVMLKFKEPAGTSRGVLTEKPTYLIKLWDESAPEVFGLGEASVFPGLSPEADGRYEYKIVELLANVAIGRSTDLSRYPSLLLGFEQAIRDFSSGGRGLYFESPFVHGRKSITINGLVWMGAIDTMLQRASRKIENGFSCLKFKIGALHWKDEYDMLRIIRDSYPASRLTIRVDANGGFNSDNVMNVLDALAKLDIHSIEQPVKAGNRTLMHRLCKESPVPIALDEELIGVYTDEERAALLDEISPRYIILKPTLCGGFSGSDSWIHLADQRSIGWWITSALESNVGLNAIAQYAASKNVEMPQGLGTGALYEHNFISPLRLDGEHLSFDSNMVPDRKQYQNLDWRE
ncbi:MAG: o-succinylbenzoate synthase [Muribaculum sp.]|nr:o-succinylbenzoate synthase [Muribaculum sp.]